MKKQKKVVELTIDDLDSMSGVDAIALTETPAIEIDFMMFSKQESRRNVFSDAEKHVLTGPALIPNLEILRIDENGDDYYVFFSEDVVEKIVKRFFKNSNQANLNYNHESPFTNQVIFESWIVADPENDKSNALGFKKLPKGTWFVSVHVQDNDTWEKLKSIESMGFSVEGYFLEQFDKCKKQAVAEAQAAVEANQKLTEEEMIEGVKNIFDSKETEDEKLAILQRIMSDLE